MKSIERLIDELKEQLNRLTLGYIVHSDTDTGYVDIRDGMCMCGLYVSQKLIDELSQMPNEIGTWERCWVDIFHTTNNLHIRERK